MGKKTPKAPAPPDPVATANAQATANRETAITQRDLNLINQITPQGDVNYTYGQPGPSGVATATATQTLSPGEQDVYNSDVRARQQLGTIANSQLGQLGQSLGTPFTISGVPNLPDRVNSVGAQAPAMSNFNTMAYSGGTQQPQAANPQGGAGYNQVVANKSAYDREYAQFYTGGRNGPSAAEANELNNRFNAVNAAAVSAATNSPSMYGQFDANGNPLWDPSAPSPNGGGGNGALQYGVGNAGPLQYGIKDAGPLQYGIKDAGPLQYGIKDAGPLQYGIKDAGAISRTLDFTNLGDPNIERQRVEQALMDRMDPYLQRDRTALESRLANQGIALGSKAYSTGIDEINRAANDARLGAIAAGGQEQSRLFGLGLGQAQFNNEAQNQQFGQNLANVGVNNAAVGQQFGQNLANANMNNSAVGQQFNQNVTSANFQNQQRQNAITEALLQRQTPLNEISALMSGSQVNSPQFVNNPATQVSSTDVTGPVYANYQGAMNNYNQRLQQNNAMMGGLFGLGGAALQSPWVSMW